MEYTIILTKEAASELLHLKANDLPCFAAVIELLRQFRESQELVEELLIPHTDADGDPTFEVKDFERALSNGFNMRILKFYTLQGSLASHRIIYGCHPNAGKYYVLSIAPRSANYDHNPRWFADVCDRYDNVGIPRIKR